jgi:hypothetical protein
MTMATPLYSVYLRDVRPRAALFDLSPMAADPAQEVPSADFALQLLLEAHHRRAGAPMGEHASLLDGLYRQVGTDRQVFCASARHYVYYVLVVATSPSPDERGHDVRLAVAVRFPWLVGALAPGVFWESAAYSIVGST